MIDELRGVVRQHDASRPRSLQKAIGPSEAGTPCSRRLAYRMLGVERTNNDTDPWAAIIGTSVHAWLDDAFRAQNDRAEQDRWLTELRVQIGDYMTGSVDLYDKKTATVIDHKIMGLTSLKKFKADGPTATYRTQVNLYAFGLILAGAKVRNVAIAAWSRTGYLRDAAWWCEPYDEQAVEDALRRLDALRTTTDALGNAALPLLPTADGPCAWCPYYLPGCTVIEEGCPGHDR